MKQRFKVDLTLECEPDYIEQLFESFCTCADEVNAAITQYRYYVEKNDESQRNQS